MKRQFLIHGFGFLLALGVSVWAWVAAGQFTLSGVALGLGALCLVETLIVLWRALSALLHPTEKIAGTNLSAERRRELEREKYYLLKAIKELDFDFEMGKLAAVDHSSIGANYRARAIRVLRLLDTTGSDEGYREMIARELKSRRKSSGGTVAAPVEMTSVPVIAASARPECRACGTSNEPDATFCKKCAQPLGPQEVSGS